MSFNFSNVAKETTSTSKLMENRVKVGIDEIIKKYPDGATVTAFDILETLNEKTGEVETYPVINIKEDEHIFFFGGAVLNSICHAWLKESGLSVSDCSAELSKAGGVRMKFTAGRTRKGNNITNVEVIG